MQLSLEGKNAIVCGASKGIGWASAFELAQLGANITLVARNSTALIEKLQLLPKSGNQSHDFLVLDLADLDATRAAINAVVLRKQYQILINNSGGPAGGPIMSADPQDFLNTFNQHVLSAQILTQAIVEGMKSAGYGRIINVISTSVKEPISGLGVSNTIRGAMGNWAKTMAMELGPFGITVNNVLPGYTYTDRLQEIIGKKANDPPQKAEVIREMASHVPLRRLGDPAEIGAAVAFLASPAAAYISGINLPVDGGRTRSL